MRLRRIWSGRHAEHCRPLTGISSLRRCEREAMKFCVSLLHISSTGVFTVLCACQVRMKPDPSESSVASAHNRAHLRHVEAHCRTSLGHVWSRRVSTSRRSAAAAPPEPGREGSCRPPLAEGGGPAVRPPRRPAAPPGVPRSGRGALPAASRGMPSSASTAR